MEQAKTGKTSDRYYALEQLTEARENIQTMARAMVVLRAKVEKFRQSDLSAARETYGELQRTCKELVSLLNDVRFLLMEVEEYQTASIAGKLADGLSAFDLMSTAYKGIYEALCKLAERLPTNEKASASVIGHLMNNVKMGYYPTDSENIALIIRGIRFPEGVTTNLLDPCCGCGLALRQLAEGNNCYTYGVELDECRAEKAQTRLHRVGFGSYFFSQISRRAFHVLFLNPPYLSVLNESGSRTRHEKRFLAESHTHLMYGGLLIYIIPYYRLTPDICQILCENFEQLSVWRFTNREFQAHKQVAVLGIRKKRTTGADAQWLERIAVSPTSIPSLTELSGSTYELPQEAMTVSTFKGERFNEKELEQQLKKCRSFAKMMSHSELDSYVKHPLLPLSIGQIGLIGGSGMINGLIPCDTPHVLKGRIVKVVREEAEEQFDAKGKHIGSEIREVVSNKMIFNVLTPKGFKALT